MTIIEVITEQPTTVIESYSLTGIPAGGAIGQSLVKTSNTDYDVEWDTAMGSGDMLRSIYDPNEDGKIAYQDLSGLPTLAANTIVINSLSDFPIQDATTITLSNDTCYVLGSFISTSKRFIVGSGVTASDIRWHFEGNSKVEDTIDDAIGYFTGNTTATVITASSTNGSNAVKVAGVWSVGRLSKFSLNSTGRATYLGERTTTAPVDVSLQLISVGGGSVRVKVYIFKNGSLMSGASVAADISGSTSKNLTIPWQVTFNQNDYIEVFVENQTNANDILVEDAILRIR